MSQSQSLEFHSAMENFSVMFPDMVSRTRLCVSTKHRNAFDSLENFLTHNFQFSFDIEQDSEVIEEILRCNRGSVERTIDQLLSISSDNQVSLSFFYS